MTAVSDIMNRGGICGIPTDVVYVLVASVKFPEAVKVRDSDNEHTDRRTSNPSITPTHTNFYI